MIAIVNVGPMTDDPGGLRNYEVRINREVICTFQHYRCDGLAMCLRLAALAAQRVERARLAEAFCSCLVTPEEKQFLSNAGLTGCVEPNENI